MNTSNAAHPLAKKVPLLGGKYFVEVRPISMGHARELKPLLVEALQAILGEGPDLSEELDLANLMERFGPQFEMAVRTIVRLPDGLEWDDIDAEDYLVLIQAVWETSILRPDGGGLLGKVVSLGAIASRLRAPSSMAPSDRGSEQPEANPTQRDSTAGNPVPPTSH